MRFQRGRDGQMLFYTNQEIEELMEAELSRSGFLPSLEKPVVELDRFVEQHLKVALDPYDTELGADVLGVTAFTTSGPLRISLNRNLTEEAEAPDAPLGTHGRWRATLAHEASHVLLHARLFPRRPAGQLELLPAEPERPAHLQRCLRRDVEPRRPGAVSDWREVQANKGMAALLMPRRLFGALARERIAHYGWDPDDLTSDTHEAELLTQDLAPRFQVSLQACRIRLRTLKIVQIEDCDPQLSY